LAIQCLRVFRYTRRRVLKGDIIEKGYEAKLPEGPAYIAVSVQKGM